MKKGLIILGLLVILMAAVAAEAQEWGRYPTLDAWRMAGYRNGYEAGVRGGYPANEDSPEYMEGYRHGSQDYYRHGCGGCDYRYYRYGYPAPQSFWGISLGGFNFGIHIGGRN